MRHPSIVVIALCTMLCGCTRVIVVPPGKPVMLMQDVTTDVSIDGRVGRATIPKGYWCLPDPSAVEDLYNATH